jgi:hypothetical protein
MAEDVCCLPVNRNDPAQTNWWRNIWTVREFETWADATGWLWDDYRGEVRKTKDGFKIMFKYEDDATLFRLTWL